MREIKFRGRLDSPKWYYGSLVVLIERDRPTYYIVDKSLGHDQLVMPCTIGQFTGFYDIDGKEIYEGDVLLAKYYPDSRMMVYWDEKSATYRLVDPSDNSFRCHDPLSVELDINYYKVVGNIHDNPRFREIGYGLDSADNSELT